MRCLGIEPWVIITDLAAYEVQYRRGYVAATRNALATFGISLANQDRIMRAMRNDGLRESIIIHNWTTSKPGVFSVELMTRAEKKAAMHDDAWYYAYWEAQQEREANHD